MSVLPVCSIEEWLYMHDLLQTTCRGGTTSNEGWKPETNGRNGFDRKPLGCQYNHENSGVAVADTCIEYRAHGGRLQTPPL